VPRSTRTPALATVDRAKFPDRRRRTVLGAGIAAVLFASCAGSPPRLLQVELTSGRIAGIELDSARAFLDVPYAAPPMGALRWREPEPAPAWDGVLGADRRLPARDPEDCLRLDVYLPRVNGAPLPLLVWFDDRAPGDAGAYDGMRLVGSGLAVAIVHTRRGVLGVFAHPALERQRPGGPANFVLQDQLAALRWLNANAAAFGADPTRITVGSSGDSTRVLVRLLGSPAARGLFQRAILHDPAVFEDPASRAEALAAGARLLADHDLVPATTASELRALPADRLLALALDGTALQGLVAADQAVGPAWRALQNGDGPPVQVLVGSTERDPGNLGPRAAARLVATAASQRSCSHLFVFRYRTPRADGSNGPPADVTAMLFAPPAPPFGTEALAGDRWLAQIVRDYWTSFVRDGAPKSELAPPWPDYAVGDDVTMVFDTTVQPAAGLLASKLDRAMAELMLLASPL